jgi:hypothetical protein
MRLHEISRIVARPEPATKADVAAIRRELPATVVVTPNSPSAYRHTIIRDPDTGLALEVISVPIPADEVPDL